MILVTVGTHEQPFDRLIVAAGALPGQERVLVQAGVSRLRPPRCEVVDWLEPDDLQEAMRRARIVVCHGGPATIFEAVAAGHVPIVVPRDPRRGEHVDDHQVRFVRRIASRVHALYDPAGLASAVADHDLIVRSRDPLHIDPERTRRFAEGVERICERIALSPPPARARRDTLRALSRWVRPAR
jgi:UDP-N-acetylglucosamine transferase subunit ALG13